MASVLLSVSELAVGLPADPHNSPGVTSRPCSPKVDNKGVVLNVG